MYLLAQVYNLLNKRKLIYTAQLQAVKPYTLDLVFYNTAGHLLYLIC